MKSLNEIAEQIDSNESCKELINCLTNDFENFDFKAWRLRKRIEKDDEKRMLLAYKIQKLESELEYLSKLETICPTDFDETKKIHQIRLSVQLSELKLKFESFSPENKIFLEIQLHEIVAQRENTEEFVRLLQKRLKKLSGDAGKWEKPKPTTNTGQHNTAA